MSYFTKRYVLFFLILSSTLLFSQIKSAKITGVISDSTSGELLTGANVILKGTSIGAATNIDGSFLITNVKPGNYTLKVSYIGYYSKEMKLKLFSGKTVSVNIKLKPVSLKGEEVVVTAQAKGQNEAINIQIQALPIMNVISSTKLGNYLTRMLQLHLPECPESLCQERVVKQIRYVSVVLLRMYFMLME